MNEFLAFLMVAGIFAIPIGIYVLERVKEVKARLKDEQLLKDNPEAWKAKEQVKLNRELLEAQKKYADEESRRQNAGTVAKIIRIFFG